VNLWISGDTEKIEFPPSLAAAQLRKLILLTETCFTKKSVKYLRFIVEAKFAETSDEKY